MEMTLWLLEPAIGDDGRIIAQEWGDKWDTVQSMVIRAATEQHARWIAADNCGAEGWYPNEKANPWLDSAKTTCVRLTYDGNPGVVCKDVLNGV